MVWLLTGSKLENGSEGVKKEPSQHDLEKYAVSNSGQQPNSYQNLRDYSLNLYYKFELLIFIFIITIAATFNLYCLLLIHIFKPTPALSLWKH